jgi:hypothetical protein
VTTPTAKTGAKIAAQQAGTTARPILVREHDAGSPVLRCCGGAPCACSQDDEQRLMRSASGLGPALAPPGVHEVLGSPGAPLDAGARTFLEPRFRTDFSQVRVHTDARAAASAHAVGARAYTVGRHIVFGAGRYSPDTPGGRLLLAHELTHTIQQGGGSGGIAPDLEVGSSTDPAEREADSTAAAVMAARSADVTDAGGNRPKVAARSAEPAVMRRSCMDMITAQSSAVDGNEAHDAITRDFVGTPGVNPWLAAGSRSRMRNIPGASSTPFRTEGYGDTTPSQIDPQILGGAAGKGYPDLAHKDGRKVEVAEIKPAAPGGLVDGEVQVLNYVTKGNSPENAGWRRSQGLQAKGPLSLMSPLRYQPPAKLSLPQSSGRQIEVRWCGPGVILYRGLTANETDVIACGTSDRGATDRFLDRALGQAEHSVDSYITTKIDTVVSGAIQSMSLREGVNLLWRHGRTHLSALLQNQLGLAAGTLLDQLPADQAVDTIAAWLEHQLGPSAEATLRGVIRQVKTDLLSRVKEAVKRNLRQYLQDSLNALCATSAAAATISIANLLDKLRQDLGKLIADAAAEVVRQWAREVLLELAKTVLIAVLVVIAVIVIVLLLPEILAALAGAAATVATFGAAIAELWPLLAGLAAAATRLGPVLQEVAE